MGAKKEPVRDYTGIVPNTPPEGMAEWAREQSVWKKNYLIYRAGRWYEPITGTPGKCVDARCTACGKTMKLEYAAGCGCARYASAPFGFRLWEGGGCREYSSGNAVLCPECGAETEALHISNLSKYHDEYRWVMTGSLIREREGLEDSLCLSFWRIQRSFSWDGDRWWTVPWEAYIFDPWGRTVRLAKWTAQAFGNVICNYGWRQNRTPKDVIRDADMVYEPEVLEAMTEESTCRNSGLSRYLREAGTAFPVAYLHLWRKHQAAEAIVTSGGGRMLAGKLLLEKERRTSWQQRHIYNDRFPEIEGADWKRKRPCEILHMNGAEYREAIRRGMDGVQLEGWLTAKKYGVRMRIPEELDALERIRGPELERLCRYGVRPSAALRYIEAQRRRYPDRKTEQTITTLCDYWGVALPAGHDARWPQNLCRAHDQQILHKKFLEDQALKEKFERRWEHCRAFEFEADGLRVIAPRTESELIAEGKCLHHCVASYAKRHAEGNITILFIRKTVEPERPYFTMSWFENEQRLCMNHTDRNRDETAEVRAFREKWEAWVKAGRRRGKDGDESRNEKEREDKTA